MKLFYCFILMAITSFVSATETITLEEEPLESVACQLLIEGFSEEGVVFKTEPVPQYVPKAIIYARAVAKLDGSMPMLIEAFHSDNERIKICAGTSLAIKADPSVVPYLASKLTGNDLDVTLACGIIQTVGDPASELVDLIRPHLYNSNFHLQYWACRALAGIGSNASSTIPDLCDRLKNGAASVRRNAALALGAVVKDSSDETKKCVRECLETALTDWNHLVREAAKDTLGKF